MSPFNTVEVFSIPSLTASIARSELALNIENWLSVTLNVQYFKKKNCTFEDS